VGPILKNLFRGELFSDPEGSNVKNIHIFCDDPGIMHKKMTALLCNFIA
jgi:hypothetical protein